MSSAENVTIFVVNGWGNSGAYMYAVTDENKNCYLTTLLSSWIDM
jgi:hypothetical protein